MLDGCCNQIGTLSRSSDRDKINDKISNDRKGYSRVAG